MLPDTIHITELPEDTTRKMVLVTVIITLKISTERSKGKMPMPNTVSPFTWLSVRYDAQNSATPMNRVILMPLRRCMKAAVVPVLETDAVLTATMIVPNTIAVKDRPRSRLWYIIPLLSSTHCNH